MKNIGFAAAALSLALSGCVSIATHEEALRRCRGYSAGADELEARVGELEKENAALKKQVDDKTAEGAALQQNITDVRATYDELVETLKGDISKGEVAVESDEGGLTITLGDKVLFASGQWELQPRGRAVLADVAKVLKKVEDRVIQVEGHTDNVPITGSLRSRFPSNWDLSSARASAVVRYLEKSGVDPKLLALSAFGDRRPVGDNKTPAGRKLNRRVEITLQPLPAETKK